MKYCTLDQSPFGLEIPNTSEIKIIKTPAGYETSEELIKYYSEDAHTRMIEEMTINYAGNAICNDCAGSITFPSNVITLDTVKKYLDINR